jgi:signal transduction histidine kinase
MRSWRQRPSGSTLLVPFLAATLGLAVWLGVHAVEAVRSHRDTAEAALRDHARIAAWESSRIARDRLDAFLDDLFDEAYPQLRRGRNPALRTVQREIDHALEEQECACPALQSSASFFRIDLRTQQFEADPDTALVAGAQSRLAGLLRGISSGNRHVVDGIATVAAGTLLEQSAIVAYLVGFDSAQRPSSALGMIVPDTSFGPLFAHWFATQPLLPPAITGDVPTDSLIRVAVYTHEGAPVVEPNTPFAAALSARDTLEPSLGSMIIETAIRPDAAPHLVIGGLPGSRLPLILVLLVLTMGVGAAALLQIRRERQLAALRDAFISGVSHELRTPLAQIRVFAELEEAGKLRSQEERQRAMSVINREATRLSHLVENVLRFSRQQNAATPARMREAVDLTAALHEAAEAMQPLASLRSMRIVPEAPHGIHALAGRDGVRQILVNLLDNAVKYGPTGQTIELRARRDQDQVTISVDDEGPGIAEADRRTIFEPYRRLTRDVEARHPGTGIGLAVVADLVALFAGRVHAERGPRGGARFVVILPADGSAAPAAKPEVEQEAPA